MKRINTSAGNTTFELEATSEMCPNTYIAVTLLQPHNNRDNDRPIRMYGVVNIHVEDPALHLNPKIKWLRNSDREKSSTWKFLKKTARR